MAFLPPGHAIANATHEIEELFGDSGKVSVVTLLFRGEALTPGGLSQMTALIDNIASDPSVVDLLVPAGLIVAPSSLIGAGLQVDSFESIGQAEIDSARNAPEIQAALAAMTGTATDGTSVSIANIHLTDTGDERVQDAERRISELAAGDEGPLRVSSLSPAVIEDEYKEATEQGMGPLIGLALLLIAALLLLFTRTLSDMLLTLLPAGRTIIDRRRESRGTLPPARPISNALPGIPQVAELLGKWVTRRPAPYLVAVILVTIGLGYAATGLKSEFSIKDILPRGGSVLEDMNTLEAAGGGSTEIARQLIKAEVTESRTLLNLHDLTTAFEDEMRRPRAAAGPIQGSYEVLVHDWTGDSGEPGDKYDPELAALFREASPGVELDPGPMQEFVDKLVAREPGLARFLINDPEGIDAMLLQFPTYLGDPEGTRMIQEEVEYLWLGDDSGVTATSGSVISVAVTDQITGGQTESISTTIAVAGSPLPCRMRRKAQWRVRRVSRASARRCGHSASYSVSSTETG